MYMNNSNLSLSLTFLLHTSIIKPSQSLLTIHHNHRNNNLPSFIRSLRPSTTTTTSTGTRTISSHSSQLRAMTKTIDSHLHVWASQTESKQYPYAPNQTPPDSLIDTSSTSSLLAQMSSSGVDGALIVQPINHQYDHRYVMNAIKAHPDKLKGMMLFDPTTTTTSTEDNSSSNHNEAISRLEELVLGGFVGVRFNPYLFQNNQSMSSHPSAMKVFKRCSELNIPVGIMCFKGIDLHYEDIITLCESSPDTMVILDHFGFASVGNDKGNDQFDLVLQLAKYNVLVKISAIFRIQGSSTGSNGKEEDDTTNSSSYQRIKKERFDKLVEVYGPDRLMFGTDFPYVTEQDFGYKGAVDIVKSWIKDDDKYDDKVLDAVMGGTAQRIFGEWN